jgi:capsule biosynthesis phosphatase
VTAAVMERPLPSIAPGASRMRICIDLDGTICTLQNKTGDYAAAKPLPGAIETINRWYDEGHHIIIFTARRMRTCQGDVQKVVAMVGDVTKQWLADHGVKHHELIFGKPYAHVYIDDLAQPYKGDWGQVDEAVARIHTKVESDPGRVF